MKEIRGLARFDRTTAEQRDGLTFGGLHWMAAGLFLAVGAEAALSRRPARGRVLEAARWAPVVAAPLAGATHALRALRPGSASRTAARLLDGIAIAVGAGAALGSGYIALRRSDYAAGRVLGRRRPLLERLPPIAALTFGATGALGLILDREEREETEARRRLERRASMIERLVPQRRARVDRIIVHV